VSSVRKLMCLLWELGTALQQGKARVRISMVSLEYFIDILPTALCLWGRFSL